VRNCSEKVIYINKSLQNFTTITIEGVKVSDSSRSLPLCSGCYAHVAGELAEGQVVDIPLKSARL